MATRLPPRFLGNGQASSNNRLKWCMTLLQTWGTTATVGGLSVIVAIVIEEPKPCRLVSSPSLSSQRVDNHTMTLATFIDAWPLRYPVTVAIDRPSNRDRCGICDLLGHRSVGHRSVTSGSPWRGTLTHTETKRQTLTDRQTDTQTTNIIPCTTTT